MSAVMLGAYTAAWNTFVPWANHRPCRLTGLPSPRLPWAATRRLPGDGAGRVDSDALAEGIAAKFAKVVLRHWASISGAALASGMLAWAMAKLAPCASHAVM